MKRSEHIFIRHLFGARIVKIVKATKATINKVTNLSEDYNKQGFSAGNHSLRLPALRPCLLILPGIIIFGASSPASATSLNLTVPDSGFTVSNMTPISNSTTLYGESTKNNVTIKTDAAWGYTLNIKAKDGATNTLKTTDNNTLNSITSASSDYKTNTTTNLNTWAFLPASATIISTTFLGPLHLV